MTGLIDGRVGVLGQEARPNCGDLRVGRIVSVRIRELELVNEGDDLSFSLASLAEFDTAGSESRCRRICALVGITYSLRHLLSFVPRESKRCRFVHTSCSHPMLNSANSVCWLVNYCWIGCRITSSISAESWEEACSALSLSDVR